MFRLQRLQAFKRFNHSAATTTSHASHTAKPTFTNKHSFNINPPAVHEYWAARNVSFLLAFIPVYLTVSYLTKYGTEEIVGFGGLIEFAKGEHSPMKEIKFAEPQLPPAK